jgi:hypothetical protein
MAHVLSKPTGQTRQGTKFSRDVDVVHGPVTRARARVTPTTGKSTRAAKRRKKLPKESVDNMKDRLIARNRTWDPSLTRKVNGKRVKGNYGRYVEIREVDLEDEAALQQRLGPCVSVVTHADGKKGLRAKLHRGGEITYFPHLLDEETRARVAEELQGQTASSYFTNYEFSNSHKEPRVHFLASSEATADRDAEQPKYGYNSTVMKAYPLQTLPELAKLSKKLAKDFEVPGGDFNIGADGKFRRETSHRPGLFSCPFAFHHLTRRALFIIP